MNFEEQLYKTIGHRIRKQRLKRRITQSILANKVGLTRTSITNIENGSQKIQLHNLYLIANVLNVDIKDILPDMNISIPSIKSELPLELKHKEREWILEIMKTKRRKK